MIDANDRKIIEAIRNSERLEITLADGTNISFSPSKILCHDIALAVQSHYNRLSKK